MDVIQTDDASFLNCPVDVKVFLIFEPFGSLDVPLFGGDKIYLFDIILLLYFRDVLKLHLKLSSILIPCDWYVLDRI